MKCSLPEYIAWISGGNNSEITALAEDAITAHKFDFGDYDEMPKLLMADDVFPYWNNNKELFNLPFNNCLFFFPNHTFLHVKQEGDEISAKLLEYDKGEDRLHMFPLAFWMNCKEDYVSGLPWMNNKPYDEAQRKEYVAYMYCLLSSCLVLLNCSNVAYVEHPVDEKVNRKRINKGKLPLHSYKTLHIKHAGINQAALRKGEQRAGLRVHLRRGHIRRLENKAVWVQACVVGKGKGFVHKNYKVA